MTHFQPCLERAQWVGLLERLTVGLRQALAGSGSQKKTSVGKRLREGSAARFPYICPPSPLASDPLSHTLGPPPHLKLRLHLGQDHIYFSHLSHVSTWVSCSHTLTSVQKQCFEGILFYPKDFLESYVAYVRGLQGCFSADLTNVLFTLTLMLSNCFY